MNCIMIFYNVYKETKEEEYTTLKKKNNIDDYTYSIFSDMNNKAPVV